MRVLARFFFCTFRNFRTLSPLPGNGSVGRTEALSGCRDSSLASCEASSEQLIPCRRPPLNFQEGRRNVAMGAAQASIGSEPIGPGGGREQVCISIQHPFPFPVLSFAAVLGVAVAYFTRLF